jgi:hypothetical protein
MRTVRCCNCHLRFLPTLYINLPGGGCLITIGTAQPEAATKENHKVAEDAEKSILDTDLHG